MLLAPPMVPGNRQMPSLFVSVCGSTISFMKLGDSVEVADCTTTIGNDQSLPWSTDIPGEAKDRFCPHAELRTSRRGHRAMQACCHGGRLINDMGGNEKRPSDVISLQRPTDSPG